MANRAIYQGIQALLRTIHLNEIFYDPLLPVSLHNVSCPASYSYGDKFVIVPATPPIWTPRELPAIVSPDKGVPDRRHKLRPYPLEGAITAVHLESPQAEMRQLDFITERRNLRALHKFVSGGSIAYRIDAEIVGNTVFFHSGWPSRGYTSSYTSYGMNFEQQFTAPMPSGTLEHMRVMTYTFGGLRMMVLCQTDACLIDSPMDQGVPEQERETVLPTGLHIIRSGVPIEQRSIAEIKTFPLTRRRNGAFGRGNALAQMWFSRTPNLIAAYHDGHGQFLRVRFVDLEAGGYLDRWERTHEIRLQKVIKLLELIKEHLASSSLKRQGILLVKDTTDSVLQFCSMNAQYWVGLPANLKSYWLGKTSIPIELTNINQASSN